MEEQLRFDLFPPDPEWTLERQKERFPWDFHKGTPISERLGATEYWELLD